VWVTPVHGLPARGGVLPYAPGRVFSFSASLPPSPPHFFRQPSSVPYCVVREQYLLPVCTRGGSTGCRFPRAGLAHPGGAAQSRVTPYTSPKEMLCRPSTVRGAREIPDCAREPHRRGSRSASMTAHRSWPPSRPVPPRALPRLSSCVTVTLSNRFFTFVGKVVVRDMPSFCCRLF